MLHLVRRHLSARLALLFLAASLLPMAGVGYVMLVRFERSIHADAERRQELFGSVVEALVVDAVARAEEKLTTVGRLLGQELEERDVGVFDTSNFDFRGAVVTQLSTLVEPPDVFLELQYFAGADAGGAPQFVANAQQRMVVESQLDRPLQSDLIINENLRTDLVRDPVLLGRPHRDGDLSVHEGFSTLRVSHPIDEPAGGTGALVAYVDFSALNSTLGRLVDDGTALRVVDAQGTVLSEIGWVDGELLMHEASIDGTGWSVTIAESLERVRAPALRLRQQVLPWFVGAALVAIAASLFFSSRITRPVARLRRAAESLERGELSARAGVERHDEIGQLGAAFDRMAGALHQLDEAKSEFVGNVSHELRTPLTSLRLTVANLLDGVTGDLEPRPRAALARVQRELERMSRLVDDLLELARLDAGAAEPVRRPVDLAALANECAEALAPTATERDVLVVVSGEGAADADEAMLRRVLVNLLDNAIKFSPGGGRVCVEIDGACFSVVDQGPGIESEELFGKFRQGAQDGVKNPGAGLGLAIVQKLVALNGGTLTARSENGAIVTVDLSGGARS